MPSHGGSLAGDIGACSRGKARREDPGVSAAVPNVYSHAGWLCDISSPEQGDARMKHHLSHHLG